MHKIFIYGEYAFFLIVLVAYVRPLAVGWKAKILLTLAFFAASSKFSGFALLGGSAYTPEFPAAVIWLWEWAYCLVLILSLLSLVWWVRRARGILLFSVSALLALWGVWNAVAPAGVREIEIAYPDLPPELDGYRIVQVTDTHTSAGLRRWRTEDWVRRVNALRADLICLTGDYVDGLPSRRAVDLEPIRELRADDGVWAVTGNHEYYSPWLKWKVYYKKWGIRFLENECVFPRDGLAIGGVNDLKPFNRGTGERYGEPPDVAWAFRAATNGEFRVLLQHQPKFARENAERYGVRLQLSGHTHGGIMPILSLVVARHNGGFVRGLYRLANNAALYLSPGTGQWCGFPVRYFNPSEIALITLRRSV